MWSLHRVCWCTSYKVVCISMDISFLFMGSWVCVCIVSCLSIDSVVVLIFVSFWRLLFFSRWRREKLTVQLVNFVQSIIIHFAQIQSKSCKNLRWKCCLKCNKSQSCLLLLMQHMLLLPSVSILDWIALSWPERWEKKTRWTRFGKIKHQPTRPVKWKFREFSCFKHFYVRFFWRNWTVSSLALIIKKSTKLQLFIIREDNCERRI